MGEPFDPADVPGDDAPVVDWNGRPEHEVTEKEYHRRLTILMGINLLGWAGLIAWLLLH